jgi:hypothetical protein
VPDHPSESNISVVQDTEMGDEKLKTEVGVAELPRLDTVGVASTHAYQCCRITMGLDMSFSLGVHWYPSLPAAVPLEAAPKR